MGWRRILVTVFDAVFLEAARRCYPERFKSGDE
jgi:hypothetical protein